MTVNISSNLVKAMLDWVELQLGLKISESRYADFEKSLCLAATDAGCQTPAEFISKFIRGNPSQKEIGILSTYLTIGETYFFRDPLSFSVLVNSVLPEVERQNPEKSVRIWSAGCSTGEEPYSIAISLITKLNDWTVDILASDINPQSLETARKGTFRRWSFREVPTFIQNRFFSLNSEHRYKISDKVKDQVKFFYLNLAQPEADFPSELNGTTNLDIIFCRNVLIYFSPEQTAEVLYRFYRALKPGGWLFLGPTEIPHPTPSFFSVLNYDGALVLQAKKSSAIEFDHTQVNITKSNYSFFGSTVESKTFDSLVQPDDSALAASSTSWSSLAVPNVNTISGITNFEESPGSLFNRGEYKRVIDRLFEASRPSNKKTTEEMALIAKSYANLGNLDAAKDWCNQLISLDVINPRWYYLKATIEQENTQDKEAIQALQQAIFLDPDFIMAHMALANIFKQHGKSDDSSRYYKNASALLGLRDSDEIVPDSDGLTVGQLLNIVRSLSPQGGSK
jgi:chemotaxis protein methyltransferase CheR